MKTKNLFLILFSLLIMASCGKDSDTLDLSKDVVGVYKGSLAVSGVGTTNDVQIRVTRIDDENVFIEPFAGGEASSFSSSLSKDSEGVILTIKEQAVTGGSIRGNIGVLPEYPDANGYYETATKAFGYAIKVNVDGVDFDEVFLGVKL